jgi:acetyltransferase
MPETDAKEMLTAYGLPVIRTEIAETEAQASSIGREMGYRGGDEGALCRYHP